MTLIVLRALFDFALFVHKQRCETCARLDAAFLKSRAAMEGKS